ncbi:DNA topoisomerase 3 [Thiocystis violacea]|uniref:DNA topoisomerase 3 n=1 Tax=Thiocystis violacea TaxID=13725 RepID=UPI001903E806|nr:DNA topoisomerase 3 [Thiocystis violacea]MBK1718075.1 DNA topoisomerase III [Thiocystis violacea]
MRLWIAEKPSVAKSIAAELGVVSRADGCINCQGDNVVTWCFGHMFEQAGPDEYTHDDVPRTTSGRKVWRIDDLPIIPKTWIFQPRADSKDQLAVIKRLLTQAAAVVHAGDPDREGQLLVDEVLQQFRCQLPVTRFWVSAQDPASIQRGLSTLAPNGGYRGFADAATARSCADWLIGMNLSRAYTLRARRGGCDALLPVGRVQTPTLALVVDRDRQIEAFRPVPYFTLHATAAHAGGRFRVTWKPQDDQAGFDSEGRLVDGAVADAIVTKVNGQTGVVSSYSTEPKQQRKPLSFALSDLTVEASRRWGYTAEQVLAAAQALYETHKLTSYPRTDCAYLPECQHADAPQVLVALRAVLPDFGPLIDGADPQIKSKTWDDRKISAHHGIIPTQYHGNANALSPIERHTYDLIVRRYLAQFYPAHSYLETVVEVCVNDELFFSRGCVVTEPGWRAVFAEAYDDQDKSQEALDAAQSLPVMQSQDPVQCVEAERKSAKTRPPAPYTEGTLIQAMEQIHRYVEDPQHRKILREGDGIGTSATRAAIIAELKRRELLVTQGKSIVSSALGRGIVDALPTVVKSPVLTAINERFLSAIEKGEGSLPAFLAKQADFIRAQVAQANDGAVVVAAAKRLERAPVSEDFKCHVCGAGLRRLQSKKPSQKRGRGLAKLHAHSGYWWSCSAYPSCTQSYREVAGKPDYASAEARTATHTQAAQVTP